MIHSAGHEDLPAIAEVYNEGGVATTTSYDVEPATLEERTTWFGRLRSQGHPVLVLEEDDRMVGFVSYGLFHDKATHRHTVEHSAHMAEGSRSDEVGRTLLGALLDHARDQGVHVMIGIPDVGNAASRVFRRNLGFIESAVLPEVGRKFGRWLDVVFVAHYPD